MSEHPSRSELHQESDAEYAPLLEKSSAHPFVRFFLAALWADDKLCIDSTGHRLPVITGIKVPE